jgi:hypothetical protein
MEKNKAFGAGSLLIVVLSLAGMAVGVLLLNALGGSSGQDLGQNAPASAFGKAVPLLVAAEVIKILSAVVQLVIACALFTGVQGTLRIPFLLTGGAGALLIAASGVVGLMALRPKTPHSVLRHLISPF